VKAEPEITAEEMQEEIFSKEVSEEIPEKVSLKDRSEKIPEETFQKEVSEKISQELQDAVSQKEKPKETDDCGKI
jgi:predicted nucleic acid-binding protein